MITVPDPAAVANELAHLINERAIPAKLRGLMATDRAVEVVAALAVDWALLLGPGTDPAIRRQAGEAVLELGSVDTNPQWWGTNLGLAVAECVAASHHVSYAAAAAVLGVKRSTAQGYVERWRNGHQGLPYIKGRGIPLDMVLARRYRLSTKPRPLQAGDERSEKEKGNPNG